MLLLHLPCVVTESRDLRRDICHLFVTNYAKHLLQYAVMVLDSEFYLAGAISVKSGSKITHGSLHEVHVRVVQCKVQLFETAP